MLLLMGAVLLLLVVAGSSKPGETLWPAYLVIGLVTVLFSSLTISVDDYEVRWYFGPFFWRKSLSLADVKSVKPIRTPWYAGLGIRLLSTGWLYNVSGLSAVEMLLKDGTTVSLGTADPQGLCEAIDSRLNR